MNPIPESAIWCGLPGALSAMATRAAFSPGLPGAKVTWNVQSAPGATALGTRAGGEPEVGGIGAGQSQRRDRQRRGAGVVPVTVCGGLVVPTACSEEKATLSGMPMPGVGTNPVPERAISCGLPGALSAMATWAVLAPALVGAKRTLNVQSPSGAMGLVQVLSLTAN